MTPPPTSHYWSYFKTKNSWVGEKREIEILQCFTKRNLSYLVFLSMHSSYRASRNPDISIIFVASANNHEEQRTQLQKQIKRWLSIPTSTVLEELRHYGWSDCILRDKGWGPEDCFRFEIRLPDLAMWTSTLHDSKSGAAPGSPEIIC